MSKDLRQKLAKSPSELERKPSFAEAAKAAGLLETSSEESDTKVSSTMRSSKSEMNLKEVSKTPENSRDL